MTNGIKVDFKKVYVLDTNIILDNVQNITTLSDNGTNLIVLPETVLNEIDSKKSGFEEINFQAREFARLLYDAKIDAKEDKNGVTIIETSVDDIVFHFLSKDEYVVDKKDISSSIKNDRKILEITKDVLDYSIYKDLTFLSLDVMARTSAIALGLKTESLNLGNNEIKNEFIKTIDAYDINVESALITDIDSDYEVQNFSYIFNTSKGAKLGCIQNNRVKLIDENSLRKQMVNPMNSEQLFFSNALLDNYYNVCIVDARAGSGKTLLTISAAMESVKRKEFEKIIYIRNSVESLQKGEEVGFLSGNEEKFQIYNYPLYDTLSYLASKLLKQSNENKAGKGDTITEDLISEKVSDLITKYQIETMWSGSMRGRTLSNSYVIVDESQNISNASMQLIMSRIDDSCKIVILGSNRQIDNAYITKHTNGLTTLLKATNDEHDEVNLFAITLEKVLRGPITEFAEKIFSK